MSDTDITRAVRRMLATMLDDIDMVHAEVDGGIVYLEGIARTAAQKAWIDRAIRQVPGVESVIDCLSLEHIAHLTPELDLALFLPALTQQGPLPPGQGRFGQS